MTIDQLNVLIDKNNDLIKLIDAISGAKIKIYSLYISNETVGGVVRLIVNKPDLAIRVLKEANLVVSRTTVLALVVPDSMETLSKMLVTLNKCNVETEYLYSFVHSTSEDDVVVLVVRTNDIKSLIKACRCYCVDVLSATEIYKY
ncbi:MAG: hypothetical protein MJ166_07195 [Clostridia bacterium]|nr:hypothetical protein [Clostridia bacterium]